MKNRKNFLRRNFSSQRSMLMLFCHNSQPRSNQGESKINLLLLETVVINTWKSFSRSTEICPVTKLNISLIGDDSNPDRTEISKDVASGKFDLIKVMTTDYSWSIFRKRVWRGTLLRFQPHKMKDKRPPHLQYRFKVSNLLKWSYFG